MAVPLNNSYEGGSNGTALTAGSGGNTGGSSLDYFDLVGSNAPVFRSGGAHGSFGMEYGSGSAAYVGWTTQMGTVTVLYARLYWKGPFPTASANRVFRARDGTNLCAYIQITTTGEVRVIDSALVEMVASGATKLVENQWNRIEFKIEFSATAGRAQLKLFLGTANYDGTTPDFDSTSAATFNTRAQATEVVFGNVTTTPTMGAAQLDDININTTGFPGPGPANQSKSPADTGAGTDAVTTRAYALADASTSVTETGTKGEESTGPTGADTGSGLDAASLAASYPTRTEAGALSLEKASVEADSPQLVSAPEGRASFSSATWRVDLFDSALKVGDLVVATLAVHGGTARTITAPVGWTLELRTNHGTRLAVATYSKRLVAADLDSFADWTTDSAVGGRLYWSAWRNASATNPIPIEAGQTGASKSITAPSVTTARANAMLLFAFAAEDPTVISHPGGGLTQINPTLRGSGGDPAFDGCPNLALYAQHWPTPSASGTRSAATQVLDEWIGQSLVINVALPVAKTGADTGAGTDASTVPVVAHAIEDAGVTEDRSVLDPGADQDRNVYAGDAGSSSEIVATRGIEVDDRGGELVAEDFGFGIDEVSDREMEGLDWGAATEAGVSDETTFAPMHDENGPTFETATLTVSLTPADVGAAAELVVLLGVGTVESGTAADVVASLNQTPIGVFNTSDGAINVFDIATVSYPGIGQLRSYRVAISDLAGTVLLSAIPATALRYSKTLNAPGACEFTLPLRHATVTPATFAPGKREVRVYREGVLVWGGYLWRADADLESDEVRCGGEGWFSRLRRRLIDTDLIYMNTDQSAIVAGLVNYTQAKSDLGIMGLLPATGVRRDRVFCGLDRTNVGEAIEELTGAEDGFDFEITPEKVMKLYYPKKQDPSGVILHVDDNVDALSYEVDASEVATRISGLGNHRECGETLVSVRGPGAGSSFGLLEDVVSFDHLRTQAELDAHVGEELRQRDDVRFQASVTLSVGAAKFRDLQVGDTLSLTSDVGFATFSRTMRIITVDVAVAPPGDERISLLLDSEV